MGLRIRQYGLVWVVTLGAHLYVTPDGTVVNYSHSYGDFAAAVAAAEAFWGF